MVFVVVAAAGGSGGFAPMLASSGALPQDVSRYACEVKWDGVRTIATVSGGELVLRSRNGVDVTLTYPELAGLPGVVGGDMVLDGEIVAFDSAGHPSFGELQKRMHVAQPDAAWAASRQTPVVFVIFDVLASGGEVHLSKSYVERRRILDALSLGAGPWTISQSFGTLTPELLEAVRARGMEGLILKRLDSVYMPGRRSDAWRKVKLFRRQEFVVGGWSDGEGARRGSFGSLLLGVYEADGSLAYAGSVGTGFTERELERVSALLVPLEREASPFAGPVDKVGGVHFVEPRLVAEVAFAEWTKEGHLRHPSYQGLRPDKNARDVVREERD